VTVLLLLWLGGCGGGGPAAVDESAPHPLSARAYRFCHEPGVDAEAAQPWCDLVDEIPEERCPGLRATCEGAPPVPASGCQQGQEGASGGPADQLADAPEEPHVGPLSGLSFDGLEPVLRWVMAILVALGILVLARFLWSRFGWRDRTREEAEVVLVEVGDDELDEALPEVPAAPSHDLLQLAEMALTEGRAGDAVVLARGAALRSLGERAVLRLHRSRTDREYVRQAPGGEVRDALRTVVAMAEAFRFGRRAPEEGAARAALAAAARLVRGALWCLALVGSTQALAQTPERYGPNGDAALLELYRQWGYEGSWRLTPLDTLGDEVDVLVVDASALDLAEEHIEAVRAWVVAGGVLLYAGPSSGFPELGTPAVAEGGLSVVGPAKVGGLPTPVFSVPPVVSLGGSGVPWVQDGDGRALIQAVRLGQGVLVGVADSRLLWNASLAVPANEHLLGDLILVGQARAGWPIATPPRVQLATQGAVASTGGGGGDQGNNPLSALARTELLPFVLQLLAWWALLGLWRGWPFGPRHDPVDRGRLRFADHVEALGERYRRLGDTRAMLAAYASLWLARVGPSGLRLTAESHGMTPEQAARWVADLEAVAEAPSGPSSDDDVQRMEELWKMVEHR